MCSTGGVAVPSLVPLPPTRLPDAMHIAIPLRRLYHLRVRDVLEHTPHKLVVRVLPVHAAVLWAEPDVPPDYLVRDVRLAGCRGQD